MEIRKINNSDGRFFGVKSVYAVEGAPLFMVVYDERSYVKKWVLAQRDPENPYNFHFPHTNAKVICMAGTLGDIRDTLRRYESQDDLIEDIEKYRAKKEKLPVSRRPHY